MKETHLPTKTTSLHRPLLTAFMCGHFHRFYCTYPYSLVSSGNFLVKGGNISMFISDSVLWNRQKTCQQPDSHHQRCCRHHHRRRPPPPHYHRHRHHHRHCHRPPPRPPPPPPLHCHRPPFLLHLYFLIVIVLLLILLLLPPLSTTYHPTHPLPPHTQPKHTPVICRATKICVHKNQCSAI